MMMWAFFIIRLKFLLIVNVSGQREVQRMVVLPTHNDPWLLRGEETGKRCSTISRIKMWERGREM